MPNLTTGFPRRTGDAQKDYEYLYDWAVSLVDELKAILCNLDSGNVSEAASVKAQNIDVSQAKIKDAQITSLTADKLTAGTIDAGNITIENDNSAGTMRLDGDSLTFEEGKGANAVIRIALGRLDTGEYIFVVQNREKTQGIYMDEQGNISISGLLKTGSKVIAGTSIEVGYGADPAVRFIKPTGAVGATIYFDDSQDALVINSDYIKLSGNVIY